MNTFRTKFGKKASILLITAVMLIGCASTNNNAVALSDQLLEGELIHFIHSQSVFCAVILYDGRIEKIRADNVKYEGDVQNVLGAKVYMENTSNGKKIVKIVGQ